MNARALLAAALCAAGCGGSSDPASAPRFPPAEPIPVAPVAPARVASVEPLSEPALPVPDASSPEAGLAESAPALADAGLPAATRATRVLLADELPYSPGFAHTAAGAPPARAKHHGHHGRPYHAAPRIVVDVSGGDGANADLQRTARNLGYWPFRTCYEEGLRRNPQLGGQVALRAFVGASGAVQRTEPLKSTMTDAIVAACVARETRKLAFPASAGDRAAAVEVSLSTGDEPVFTPRPVANAETLREALRSSWSAVERCYSDRLAKAPDVGGRMELRFQVQPDGEVADVAEAETRFSDVEVTRCVVGVYHGARLPLEPAAHHARPRAGSNAEFVYALHFEATESARQ